MTKRQYSRARRTTWIDRFLVWLPFAWKGFAERHIYDPAPEKSEDHADTRYSK